MNLSDRITINPEQCGGRPCIRGMRIRVIDVLDLFAAGLSAEEILAEMPDLELDDLKAALQYASRRIDHPVLAAWRYGAPPKVIWLTCGNTSNARLKQILFVTLIKTLELLATGEQLVEINSDWYCEQQNP